MKRLLLFTVLSCAILFVGCDVKHHVEGRDLESSLEDLPPTEPPANLTVPSERLNETVTIGSVVVESTTKFNVSKLLRDVPESEERHADIDDVQPPTAQNLTAIDTEIPNLLKNPEIQQDQLHQQPMENHEAIQLHDGFDDETEFIENGKNTEDDIRRTIIEEESDAFELKQRHFAVIVACALVVVAVLCYAGLWSWRRYLERRYGSRTMLVNAEEFDDPNDIHHFSI